MDNIDHSIVMFQSKLIVYGLSGSGVLVLGVLRTPCMGDALLHLQTVPHFASALPGKLTFREGRGVRSGKRIKVVVVTPYSTKHDAESVVRNSKQEHQRIREKTRKDVDKQQTNKTWRGANDGGGALK